MAYTKEEIGVTRGAHVAFAKKNSDCTCTMVYENVEAQVLIATPDEGCPVHGDAPPHRVEPS